MPKAIRILAVSDREKDVRRWVAEAEKADHKVECQRVSMREELEAALGKGGWDVVLCDYDAASLPGLDALRKVRAGDETVPFIFISGQMGENRLLEVLREGANDCVPKGDSSKLISAIEREVRAREISLQRARALERLRESEERYRELFDSAPVGYHEVDSCGVITKVNRTELKLFGYKADEMIGKPAWAFVIDSDASRERLTAKLAEIMPVSSGGGQLYVRKDGSTFPALVDESHIRDKKGKVIGIRTVVQDISARKLVEMALAKEKNLLQTLMNNLPDAIFFKDSAGKFILVNPALARHFGMTETSGVIGKKDSDFFDQEHARLSLEAETKVMKTGTPIIGEEQMETWPNGQTVWVSTTRLPLRNEKGETVGTFGISRDITERKKWEDTLLTSQKKLASAMEIARLGHWEYDVCDETFTFNDQFYHMLHTTAGSAGGYRMTFPDFAGKFIPPDEIELVRSELEKAVATNDADYSRQFEHRVLYADQGTGYVAVRIFVEKDGRGRTIRTYGVYQDITQRKRVLEKVEEQAALLDEAHDAISVMDLKAGIALWNKGAEELYGWKASEVLGKIQWTFSENDTGGPALQPDQPTSSANEARLPDDTHRAAYRTTLAEGKWKGELHQRTRAGKEIFVLSNWALIRNKDATPRSILFINTDISEQKSLEAQYRRAQRMETLGTLASGIAHDLNNVLTPIGLAIEILQRKHGSDNITAALLKTLESTVNRGAGVVRQILAFARGAETQFQLIDPRLVMGELKRIISQTFPKNISLVVEVDDLLDRIYGDKTQINQILVNLCINSRDAMPGGGTLAVSVRNRTIDEQYAGMARGAKAGKYVVFQVRDTGVGIGSEELEKLFDPFYTTKGAGKSAGLGLTIVRGLVENHSGFVEVESELHKGTTFRVCLPAAVPGQLVPKQIKESRLRIGHGEIILIADDEAAIREISKTTLEAYGYRVLVAGDGSEAVSVFAKRWKEISLVVTDMLMPIMDGNATISALRKINPAIKVIVATGYVDADVASELSRNVIAILRKPYSAGELMKAVGDALEYESPPA